MADLYIVTTEAIADGMWFDEPDGYDDEASAREAAALKR